jgi:glutathione S-transferase
LLLSVHELPFEEVRIPLRQDDTYTLLARYTEAGKVPVLIDDDLTVWDSMAISEYVSEQYLSGGGWPSAARARAEARSCSAEMHSGFPEIRGQLPMNCRATGRKVPLNAPLEKELARIDRIWSRCRETYAGAGPWLFGGFSIADCMFAPVALRFRTYGIELSKTAADYMDVVLDNEKMRQWIEQACAESEIIEMAEVGG